MKRILPAAKDTNQCALYIVIIVRGRLVVRDNKYLAIVSVGMKRKIRECCSNVFHTDQIHWPPSVKARSQIPDKHGLLGSFERELNEILSSGPENGRRPEDNHLCLWRCSEQSVLDL